jgi:hypothetical protein
VSSAELLQKRLGTQTMVIESQQTGTSSSRPTGGMGGKDGGQVTTNSGTTFSETGQPLMRLEEILQMEGTAIITHRSQRPILARLVPYFSEEFKTMAAGRPRLGPRAFMAAGVLMLCGIVLAAGAAVAMPGAARDQAPAGFYSGRVTPEGQAARDIQYGTPANRPPVRRAVSPLPQRRPQASPEGWRGSRGGTPWMRTSRRDSRVGPGSRSGGGAFAPETLDEATHLSFCHRAGGSSWPGGVARAGDPRWVWPSGWGPADRIATDYVS